MSGFVDRAQIVRKTRTGERVDGRYISASALSTPFRCRFDPGNETESRDAERIRRVKPATLSCRPRDFDGQPLAISADDEIEIVSARYGTIRMQVDGAPRAERAKRAIKAWTVQLKKVTA